MRGLQVLELLVLFQFLLFPLLSEIILEDTQVLVVTLYVHDLPVMSDVLYADLSPPILVVVVVTGIGK